MSQQLITTYFKKEEYEEEPEKEPDYKVYGFNQETNSWHCLECGVDMGKDNSRQLCGKSKCVYA